MKLFLCIWNSTTQKKIVDDDDVVVVDDEEVTCSFENFGHENP